MRILLLHNYYQRPGGEDAVVAAEKDLLTQHGRAVERDAKPERLAAVGGRGRVLSVISPLSEPWFIDGSV